MQMPLVSLLVLEVEEEDGSHRRRRRHYHRPSLGGEGTRWEGRPDECRAPPVVVDLGMGWMDEWIGRDGVGESERERRRLRGMGVD